ncbi:MAG: hypothetical protein IJW30_01680 [Clostridia bacterium]|nr:hypothetical protein [Clostridia bacterium]
MKNQHTKLVRRFHPIKLAVLMAMLLIVGCFCGAFTAFAAESDTPVIVFDSESGIVPDGPNRWMKVYDGTAEIDVADVTTFVLGGKSYEVESAVFDSKDAGDRTITITYDGNKSIKLNARIEPKSVALNATEGLASVAYNPTGLYSVSVEPTLAPDTPLLNAADFVEGELLEASVSAVAFESAALAGDTVDTVAKVVLTAGNAVTDPKNYTVALLPTTVTIGAVELTDVTWSNGGTEYRFVYGAVGADGEIPACLDISAKATAFKGTANEKTVDLVIMVEIGGKDYELAQAYKSGLYGNVYEGNTEEAYTIKACAPENGYYALSESATTARVVIEQAVYNVSFPQDSVTYLGEADMSDLTSIKPLIYEMLVEGENVPAELLGQIVYTYTNQATGDARRDGVTEAGIYTVTAKMPNMAENGIENYRFNVSELAATLIIKKNYINLDNRIIIVGKDGLKDGVSAKLSIPETLDRNAIRGYKVHKEYTLEIFGAEKGQTFTLLIPVDSALVSNLRCEALTAEDLYLYDGVGNMVSANGKYKVTLIHDEETGKPAYYKVENYSAASDVTFVIAPVYNAPFWVSAPGIALIILLVLLLLLVMFLVGLKLRQIERSRQSAALVIDTEGEVPAYAEVEPEEKIEDVDACLEESIDEMADSLSEDVAAETPAEAEVDATEAVEEALEEVADEASALELDEQDPETAEGEALAEAMAANVAEELQETVEAGNDADVSEEVESAVATAMEENFNESADAAAAIALVDTDEDDDNDEDEDDDNGAFFGAFAAGLTYIDVMAEPEKYAEMLEQERLGEVQLVYRYRRSYQSRLAQSQGSVQDYYNIIKNKLLSYKGIKSRVSWNYEAFNLGRTHVAKFNAKTRTLYLYMALDPAELTDTKYGFADMSSKKKYATVPVLMKIKGDRKFKHALELITLLCEEKLGLQTKKVVEEVDYKLPYMTTDELVNEGMVKKLAAAIPMSLLTGETEEAPVEEAPVEETVEETVEEAPVEDAPAEEIPADAEASEDEPENV